MNMAQYTENYSLHQWEAEDPFLRTDFNGDFSKIDAALGRAERSSRANAYNLYNLLLQSQYEGKYTGYKKALLFDGFLDESGVKSVTAGLGVDGPNRSLFLDSTGQGNLDRGLGHATNSRLQAGSYWEEEVTPAGNGTLTAIQLYCDGPGRFELYEGEVLLDSGAAGENTEGVALVTFSLSAQLSAGRSYRVRFVNCAGYALTVGRASESGGFGYRLCITPIQAVSGTLITKTLALESAPEQAMAWVRHSEGTVTLALGNGEEAWTPMTAGEGGPATELNGAACIETPFRLENLPVLESLAVRLTVAGNNVRVYDYGVILR